MSACLFGPYLNETEGRTQLLLLLLLLLLVGGWLELFNDDDGNNVRDLLEIIFRGQDRCCAPGWLDGWMDASA